MYKHYKTGDKYEIISDALDSDNLESLIVYKSVKTGQVWVRPKEEFFSEVDGIPRFTPIIVNNNFDGQYMKLINHILINGRDKSDRTGVGTRSITSYSFNIDISEYFPLLTIKKTFYESVFGELIWFLKGSTCANYLNTKIWCANSSEEFLKKRGLNYEKGYIGPSYGYQWRGCSYIPGELQWENQCACYMNDAMPGVDQIQYIIDEIKNNPDSRRILMSNWDVNNVQNMALPPCHVLFQVVVRGDYLDSIMYQRSADLFLGVPFNVASYSALVYILAKLTGKKPGIITIHFGDVHIYSNHIEQAQLLNDSRIYDSPKLEISDITNVNDISMDHFKLTNYKCGPFIKVEMAI